MDQPITYHDTRGLDRRRPAFTDILIQGIASGGGLFVPEEMPRLSLDGLLALGEMPYRLRASHLFKKFRVDLPGDLIEALMERAYGSQWDDDRIAPVVEAAPGMHVLELWHGPTSAFKDMALQCMPRFFSQAIQVRQERGELEDNFLILVATSGDTGKAALEGFADREHTGIIVFYPADGVSAIQRKQMVTQRGSNVGVFGVRGNFDDCQSAVKEAFNDGEFNRWLHDRKKLRLSSANSINWGRLLPQIVYYASAYVDLAAQGALKAGELVDVCVPTGNFGNILAAFYAREIGVPIDRLLCASNENDVLADFLATGIYDISGRPFVNTPSPSMDILISSNLERLLHRLAGPAAVRTWMADLARTKRFEVDPATFQALGGILSGGSITNDESLSTIRRVWQEARYLLDPHTAVAWSLAERMRGERPMLVVSTAHWAKFGADVLKALRGIPYAGALSADPVRSTGNGLLAQVLELAEGCSPVPRGLASLDEQPERFLGVVDAGRDGVESAVRGWLS